MEELGDGLLPGLPGANFDPGGGGLDGHGDGAGGAGSAKVGGTLKAERAAEEREYVELFSLGRHGVAEGLRVLGPDSLDAVMLRDKRPYTTMTKARFPAVDALARELLYQLALSGTVEYETLGEERRLTVRIDAEEDDGDLPGAGEAIALCEDGESYRLFLTDGVFTEAVGFELADDGRSATLAEVDEEELEQNGGILVLRLAWRPNPA